MDDISVTTESTAQESGDVQTSKTPAIDPKTFKHKVKLDGKEVEVTLEEMTRDYQIKKLSDKKLHEAAMKIKKAEEFSKMLKENPKAVLRAKELGFSKQDIRRLAEDIIAEEIEEQRLSPQEREARETKRALEEERQKRLELENKEKTAHQQALSQKYAQEYETQLIQELEKSGLPKTPKAVALAAKHMLTALKAGYKLTVQDVVNDVKHDLTSSVKDVLADLDGAALENILGQEIADKLRKHSIEKLKNPSYRVSQEDQPSPTLQKKKVITSSEWRRKFS